MTTEIEREIYNIETSKIIQVEEEEGQDIYGYGRRKRERGKRIQI